MSAASAAPSVPASAVQVAPAASAAQVSSQVNNAHCASCCRSAAHPEVKTQALPVREEPIHRYLAMTTVSLGKAAEYMDTPFDPATMFPKIVHGEKMGFLKNLAKHAIRQPAHDLRLPVDWYPFKRGDILAFQAYGKTPDLATGQVVTYKVFATRDQFSAVWQAFVEAFASQHVVELRGVVPNNAPRTDAEKDTLIRNAMQSLAAVVPTASGHEIQILCPVAP